MVAEPIFVTIATSLASGLLKGVCDKAVDAVSKSSRVAGLKSVIFGDLRPQLIRLKKELLNLQAVLHVAESINPLSRSRNDLILHWLESVKDAAYFADNLLDDISYEEIRRQVEKKLFSSSCSLLFDLRIANKVNKFMSMTADIYEQAKKFGVKPVKLVANASGYQPAHMPMSSDLRERRENVDTSYVVGRQYDENLIVQELCRPNSDQVLPVIAIVGISGVGKTTLARTVYDNEIVGNHFKKKIWIFVSDNLDLRRILKEMLESLTSDNCNLSNIGAMEKMLQYYLGQERYLLVLDDVWNPGRQVWDSVRTSLDRVTHSSTSRLLLTTRSRGVASLMGAFHTHDLKILRDSDAWTLFKENAFANKSQDLVSDLEDIGKMILKKCGGLPLAIKTLGSLLGSMNEISQWE